MDNYPGGYMYPDDQRSPLHNEVTKPTCSECGEELTIDADCDADGPFSIQYCENKNCGEYGELA